MNKFITCTLHQVTLERSKPRGWDGLAYSRHGKDEKCIWSLYRKMWSEEITLKT